MGRRQKARGSPPSGSFLDFCRRWDPHRAFFLLSFPYSKQKMPFVGRRQKARGSPPIGSFLTFCRRWDPQGAFFVYIFTILYIGSESGCSSSTCFSHFSTSLGSCVTCKKVVVPLSAIISSKSRIFCLICSSRP